MTAAKLVEEPILVHGLIPDKKERGERVLQLLREVGLDIHHAQRFPHEFSGGQRQRINVARALSMNPKVIVCDEPVSALDVSVQAQVLNLFNRLQKEYGLTYIFISHDLGVIKHVSDRIAIMYLGRIVELCAAEKIYEDPLHPYTKALLSAIPTESPFEKKERIVLKGEIPSPIGEQVGCPLAGRCPNCMERCRKEIPALKDRGDGHQVACFYMIRKESSEDMSKVTREEVYELAKSRSQELVKLVSDLIRIPSENPTGTQREVVDFVKKYLSDAGISCEEVSCNPDYPCVLA